MLQCTHLFGVGRVVEGACAAVVTRAGQRVLAHQRGTLVRGLHTHARQKHREVTSPSVGYELNNLTKTTVNLSSFFQEKGANGTLCKFQNSYTTVTEHF